MQSTKTLHEMKAALAAVRDGETSETSPRDVPASPVDTPPPCWFLSDEEIAYNIDQIKTSKAQGATFEQVIALNVRRCTSHCLRCWNALTDMVYGH